MAIADLRRNYTAGELERQDLQAEPLDQFQTWFDAALHARGKSRWRKIGIAIFDVWQAVLGNTRVEVNAMTLATVGADGKPSSRTVLLKGADARGFIFYTNYESRKGRELAANPNAALTFFWPELERQVCIAGPVTKVGRAESEAYFKSRPKGSRLGAWASNQSGIVVDRAALEKLWQEVAAKFPGDDVPVPPHWGGFVLRPERIEFWQGRLSRMHDRFCYTRQADDSWRIERLAP
jgi:pyridoxamine 5'-phosphate oxidase